MRVLLVHLFSMLIEHLDAAHTCLHGFAEVNAHFIWYFLYSAADPWFCTKYKCVSIDSHRCRYEAKQSESEQDDLFLHDLFYLEANNGRPRLRGNRSSR